MPTFKTIDDLDVQGKYVLVRSDLNVPMKDGQITDSTRIQRSAQTLTELAQKGAKVVVMSHFGRPKGERVPAMSLRPVASALSTATGFPVAFAEDCIGVTAKTVVNGMGQGDIVLLENLRYHSQEEKNDPDFARALAELGELYVNDAFSTSHRAHASTEGLAHLLPAAAGRLMQAELEALGRALERPEHPVGAIVGGAKISTKLDLLGNLAQRVDLLVIGGGMANTFLHAQGIQIGKSLCEKEMAETARAILDKAEKSKCTVVLPTDVVVANSLSETAERQVVPVHSVPEDQMILDIGPDSARALSDRLASFRTLVWNGPLGAFEIKPFDAATNLVAQAAADLTRKGNLLTVAGGGDTVGALANAGVQDQFSYVSTAGGAFLEWLEGRDLPGVKALEA
ncbi:phosphoglycerate kinase [Haematospirillum jordaniae]|uniref:Phosphoglycerate kinase n=1 Tax=Haematospirillum jordaniae TaxID=1549855 RepID=A0A143DD13_9PROT|nr:phosphoglycerate kinase [Haematospirillum jordaniae]AMW34163.1 phosphoglycerate kinase [Haematospirillum jordaniae]NKD45867.1 phosphoglycerate kinase [Haematospirillum jordaniae]NKD57184.1 phosphoglycerate kinase [Haematospirillum jordaniae]NKD59417.1 phosphoglycerate kinase [Haematospirillum jordaniae]NKD67110.1 phosphoglycerate kinase [Haematospirillum jordaniae]